MNSSYIPVAKRTRLQCRLLAQGSGGPSSSKGTHNVSKNVDESSVYESEEETSYENGSGGSSRSTRRKLDVKVEELSVDEMEEEKSIESASEDSSILRRRGHDEEKRVDVLIIDDSEEETSNANESGGTYRSNKHGEYSVHEAKVERSDSDGCYGTPRRQSWNQNRELGYSKCDEQEVHEVINVDDYSIDQRASRKATPKGSDGSSRSTSRRLEMVGESSVDQWEEEKSSESASEYSSISRRRRRDDEAKGINELSVDESEEETNGSGEPSGSNSGLMKSNENDESSVDGSEEEESHHSLKESDGDKEFEKMESAKIAMKNHSYGSASSFKTGPDTYFIYSSDDSDSDDSVENLIEEEEADEDLQISCKYHEIQDQSTEDDEDESSSSSDSSDDFVFFLPNNRVNQLTNWKESPIENTRETVWSGSVDRKEKKHSVRKTNMKKVNLKPTNSSTGIHTHEKTNAKDKASYRYTTIDKANAVKYQESSKPRRLQQKDDGALVDSLLDSVIANGDVHHKEGDDCLALQFRFDDSEDESSSQKSDVSDMEGLFQEMDFALTCEEIGSYKTPLIKNQEKDDDGNIEANPFKLCQREEHSDIYLEEQTGFRCGLCGAVVLESRYVIPKLANYAPDKSKRSYLIDEQFATSENVHFGAPDWNPLDIYKQSKGTVWELIPASIRAHLYPHQQEGFKFLWENLAGTIELSKLHKRDQRSGGGCIISHAPGTGKTLLAIVFLESFLKKFPKCCPVIVAPVSMLLTWEAEFKKWKVGFSFLNLNSFEFLSKEANGKLTRNKDVIRAMKISSWSNGGSVLGVSYNLYEKLAGNGKNMKLKKLGNILLDKPGLVVLDEGHTPRNQRSKIWNVLKKLKTRKRVILSGTPFQNNFRELFNTLHLVRPATWTDMMNQKMFAEMIQPKRKKKSRSSSASEDIESLKAIISPFVHVHKGKILESKLPGLKSSVILLNPPPLQKQLIKKLGNLAKTFEYEHKVALVSVHPSLILHCSLSNEKNSMNEELKKVRLQPDCGVKTRFVMELIRLSVSLDEKVLIFSQYIEPLKLLKDQIALVFHWKEEREIMFIEGRIHQKQRQMIINDFNDPSSEVKVLLASTRCCSEGIHLIGASRVVLLDVVWNPSVERQAISRAYRLGQKKVVYTYHLMASGTTEEEKYDRQVEKERLGELVFSSSAMSGEVPQNNEKANVIKLNDKILQQMVDHQELNHMFKEIRYPEKQTTN